VQVHVREGLRAFGGGTLDVVTVRSVLHAGCPDIATGLWHTGIDPFTKKEVFVAKGLKDRKMQRALMRFLSQRITSGCGKP
jgi:hypothetical protein